MAKIFAFGSSATDAPYTLVEIHRASIMGFIVDLGQKHMIEDQITCFSPRSTARTGRAPDLVRALQSTGWRATVIGTPTAEAWLDADAVAKLTGSAPRVDFRSPSEPKLGGPPSAVVVCPATFNTVNKAAAGAADTYALAVMCEALATGIPLIVVPMVSTRLWGHPAWQTSLTVLRNAGTALVNIQTGELDLAPAPSGSGDEVTVRSDPRWIVTHVERLLRRQPSE